MAKVRIEWCTLGQGVGVNGIPEGQPGRMQGSALIVDVTGTVTIAGSRPTAPANCTHARIIGLAGFSVVAYGTDPTAAIDNGPMILPDKELYIPVKTGTKLSFIEGIASGFGDVGVPQDWVPITPSDSTVVAFRAIKATGAGNLVAEMAASPGTNRTLAMAAAEVIEGQFIKVKAATTATGLFGAV